MIVCPRSRGCHDGADKAANRAVSTPKHKSSPRRLLNNCAHIPGSSSKQYLTSRVITSRTFVRDGSFPALMGVDAVQCRGYATADQLGRRFIATECRHSARRARYTHPPLPTALRYPYPSARQPGGPAPGPRRAGTRCPPAYTVCMQSVKRVQQRVYMGTGKTRSAVTCVLGYTMKMWLEVTRTAVQVVDADHFTSQRASLLRSR